jgi:hypothetical protein
MQYYHDINAKFLKELAHKARAPCSLNFRYIYQFSRRMYIILGLRYLTDCLSQ